MVSEAARVDAYLATLAGWSRWWSRPSTSCPGHGGPIDGVRAAAILREDRAYLEALPDAPLPLARRTGAQRKIHARTSPGSRADQRDAGEREHHAGALQRLQALVQDR